MTAPAEVLDQSAAAEAQWVLTKTLEGLGFPLPAESRRAYDGTHEQAMGFFADRIAACKQQGVRYEWINGNGYFGVRIDNGHRYECLHMCGPACAAALSPTEDVA